MARGVKQIKWDLDRIREQVRSVCVPDDQTGCLLWAYGGTVSKRYPAIMIKGIKYQVSRLLLEVSTGVTGDVARHTCDRPPCCNEEHLLWGTTLDNVRDAFERGRRVHRDPDEDRAKRRVNRPYQLAIGSAHGRHKLNEQQVRRIRERHENGDTVYRLSKEYGVTKRAVTMIVRRETWRHV